MCDMFYADLKKSGTEIKYNLISNKLNELKKIQQERIKSKMKLIGKVKMTLVDGSYQNINEGNLSMSSQAVLIERKAEKLFEIPASVIIAFSFNEKVMTIQMKPDFIFEQCLLEFHSEEQLKRAVKLIPFKPIPGEVYYEHNVYESSSDTDSDESGRGKTQNLDGSFDSERPSKED